MKKTLGLILLCGIMIIGIVGCKNEQESEIDESNNLKIIKCLENELGGYIATENDVFSDIPLSDITNKKDKLVYYKGVSANEQNRYIIVETNMTYEWEVMRDFELYFSKKYPIYQRYALPYTGVYIYIHNSFNDINFDKIKNKCVQSNLIDDGKIMPLDTINELNKTEKIVIKSGEIELGTITNEETISKILDTISTSKQYGDAFTCDGNSFDFEMYNDKNELIDTIYIWYSGKRLMPKSIHNGCSYYSTTTNDFDLREMLEKEIDYVFYGISDYSDICTEALELIYEDDNYNYYLSCEKSNEVLITFDLSNRTMTLKYALNNNYIKPEKLSEYTDLLIKVEK